MKRRIVACILSLAMLFTDIVPVAAGVIGGRGSDFQKTIDWLFDHSNEIGYAEISAVAADMKPDYSLLRDSLKDSGTCAEVEGILDAYVRVRAGKSSGNTAINNAVNESHRKLWEYFRDNIKFYEGNVLQVQPLLQVRDVREKDKEVVLSVFEWVYMTYEINGVKDISAYGFDHQMVFQMHGDDWSLVLDNWDAGDGNGFTMQAPGVKDEDYAGDSSDSSPEEPKDDVKESSTTDKDEILENEEPSDIGSSLESDDLMNGNDADNSQDDRDPVEGDEEQGDNVPAYPDKKPDNDEKPGENQVPDNGNAGEDEPQGSDTESGDDYPSTEIIDGEDKFPDNGDTEEDVVPEADADAKDEKPDKNAVGEEAIPDKGVSEENSNPEENTTQEIESTDNPADVPVEEGTANDNTYNGIAAWNNNFLETGTDDALFAELNEREEQEAENPFAVIQDQLSAMFTPLSTTFSLQTFNYTYSYQKAVEYADKYALGFNPAYGNFNNIGGDCANYVSQCLYAGGLPMTDQWYYRNGKWSSSWSTASGLFNYLSTYCGTAVVNADPEKMASEVTAGNPVFYYGYDSSRKQYRYRHATICVGVNASGVPVVDAHNKNYLRAVWTLNDNSIKRAVVKINGNSSNAQTEVPPLLPEEVEEGETWRVTTQNGLNLRQDAGTNYEVVSTIPSGKNICIVEKKSVGEQTWGKTTYNGVTGWCCLVYSPNVSYAAYVSGSMDGSVATGVRLDKTTVTISGIGETLKLNATVTPTSASSSLVWTSSNPSIATVSDGLVKALSDGTVVITAQAKDGFGASASCTVHVGRYTVKYNLNGGKNDSRNKGYYYRSSGMTLYNPTRKGYLFGGWYTKKNLTGKITGISAGKTTNYTLYAKWTKLGKPTVRKLKRTGAGKIKVYLKKKITRATGYEIQCATNSKFTKGIKTKKTKSINKTVTGLKKGKRYYVRVRAYTKLPSGEYVYGSYSGYRYTKA